MTQVMNVSVILPTFNGERWIRDTLAALSEQDYPGDWELLIADNGSTDDTRTVVSEWTRRFPFFRLLDASRVRGQSHARNEGARQASGDLLLFTDQDDIVTPNWLANLADGLSSASIVTGPVAHFVDGRPPSGDNLQPPQLRLRVGPFNPPIGCNMGIVRDVLSELGGFDERITLGWEDIDLGVRAGLLGITTAWIDGAVVLHRRPSSTLMMWRKEYGYGRGWTKFERRYPQLSPNGWVRPLMRRAGWVIARSPYIAFPARRRAWIVRAAGVAGRLAERIRPSE